jgi:hypothetical protein
LKSYRSFALSALFACCAAASMVATPACSTHDCDSSTIALGSADAGGTGYWLPFDCDTTTGTCWLTWYSSPTMNSGWTDFPGNATVTFTFPPLPPLPPGIVPDFAFLRFSASVAAGTPTSDDGFNVTSAAGQLDELTSWSSTSISVMNASCSEYWLQLIVSVPVVPLDAGLPGLLPDAGDGDDDGGDGGQSGDAATQADASVNE